MDPAGTARTSRGLLMGASTAITEYSPELAGNLYLFGRESGRVHGRHYPDAEDGISVRQGVNTAGPFRQPCRHDTFMSRRGLVDPRALVN